MLNYLCDNCYAGTAQVFASESSTRELDGDGDEVMTGGDCGVMDPQVLRLRKGVNLNFYLGLPHIHGSHGSRH